jgi:hypothetical protein
LMEYRIESEDGNLPAGAVPQQKTPNHLKGFPPPQQFPGNAAYKTAHFPEQCRTR